MDLNLFIYPSSDNSIGSQAIGIYHGSGLAFPFVGACNYVRETDPPNSYASYNSSYFNNTFRTFNGMFYFRVGSSLTGISNSNVSYFRIPLMGMPDTDNYHIDNPLGKNRIELRNKYGVLVAENNIPKSDGIYPPDSKYKWMEAPTLIADEVQDDPDVFKLICTPNNLQSDSIALYGAVGAGDPELIETKATAASISFNVPIAELDPGTYTFTAVPVKGTASGIASAGVELVIPEPEPEPEPDPEPGT